VSLSPISVPITAPVSVPTANATIGVIKISVESYSGFLLLTEAGDFITTEDLFNIEL
jgi:hypothetical protein